MKGLISSMAPEAIALAYGTEGMAASPAPSSAAMRSSTSSVTFSSASLPPRVNAAMPLYSAGVGEQAVMAMPYGRPRSLTVHMISGVGACTTLITLVGTP